MHVHCETALLIPIPDQPNCEVIKRSARGQVLDALNVVKALQMQSLTASYLSNSNATNQMESTPWMNAVFSEAIEIRMAWLRQFVTVHPREHSGEVRLRSLLSDHAASHSDPDRLQHYRPRDQVRQQQRRTGPAPAMKCKAVR
jgi:hypothetical protein